jgi:hypothetical protein
VDHLRGAPRVGDDGIFRQRSARAATSRFSRPVRGSVILLLVECPCVATVFNFFLIKHVKLTHIKFFGGIKDSQTNTLS